jgi:hypothetical protein
VRLASEDDLAREFALKKGPWNYVIFLESQTGETLKLRIRMSDGAIKRATSKSR